MSKNIQKASPTPISKSSLIRNTKPLNKKEEKPKEKKETTIKNFEEDSDFFEDFTPYQRTGRIIHQSTEQSYDDKGNKVTKTKIIREIDDSSSNKKNYHEIKISNNKRKNKIEIKNEKEKDICLSPDFQESPIMFDSSNNFNDNIEEMGYKTNYVYESRKVNGKNIGEYSTKEKYEYINRKNGKESRYEKSTNGSPRVTEIISPVHYAENSSGGSDFDENQIQSFDNFRYSIKTNNTNINNQKRNKIKLNYELEDPEGFDYLSKNERKVSNEELKSNSRYINRSKIRNKYDDSSRSDIRDFQSPDKNIETRKNFRKVNVGMIESKGPSNDDRKINNIITKEVIQTSDYKNKREYNNNIKIENYDETNYYYNEDENVRIKAAKIIQEWWRTRFNREQEEEVYDITMKSAIKLQSFIRGFLVRKKVLRYITLAIYYQSFCDKLQDVLCNYIKKEIFQLFKNKYLYKTRSIKRISKESIIKRRNLLINIIKKNTDYYYSFISYYLYKWKNITQKLKEKTRIKEGYKSIKTTSTSKTIFNTNNKSTMTYTDGKVISRVKTPVKTMKKESERNIIKKEIDNKNINIVRTKKESERNIIQKEINNSTRTKKEESTSRYSRRNNEKYSSNTFQNNSTKKSLNTVFHYTNENENISNYKYFNRVEKSTSKSKSRRKEDDRGVSPKFGVLRKTVSSTNTNITNNIRPKKQTTITVKNRSTLTNLKTQKKEGEKEKKKISTIINSRPSSNISTIKISDVRTSNERTNYFKSTEIMEEKRRRITTSEDVIRREIEYFPEHAIDNQMAISIIKLPNNDLNKSMELPEKIKLKERIIIQKEAKPETAEEGNNMQIFDMKVSKRVSMYIEPAMEFRKIIREEQKELEIFKKREREKNKVKKEYYKKNLMNLKIIYLIVFQY